MEEDGECVVKEFDWLIVWEALELSEVEELDVPENECDTEYDSTEREPVDVNEAVFDRDNVLEAENDAVPLFETDDGLGVPDSEALGDNDNEGKGDIVAVSESSTSDVIDGVAVSDTVDAENVALTVENDGDKEAVNVDDDVHVHEDVQEDEALRASVNVPVKDVNELVKLGDAVGLNERVALTLCVYVGEENERDADFVRVCDGDFDNDAVTESEPETDRDKVEQMLHDLVIEPESEVVSEHERVEKDKDKETDEETERELLGVPTMVGVWVVFKVVERVMDNESDKVSDRDALREVCVWKIVLLLVVDLLVKRDFVVLQLPSNDRDVEML